MGWGAEDSWDEDGGEEEVTKTGSPTPDVIVTNKPRPSKSRLSSSVITDYFSVTRTEMAGAETT